MRRLLLAATALTVSSSAFAGEPSTPGAAAFAASPRYFNWTGCYLGGNVGPGWGNANFSGSTAIAPTTSGGDNVGSGVGVLGGGQIGCNIQVSRNWVLGAEGDFGWSNISGTDRDPFFSGKNKELHSQTDWIASATGRVAYAFDNWLFYAKGGAAWEHSQYGFSVPPIVFPFFVPGFNGVGGDTRLGATGGGGIEWAFAPGWSARAEFDFYGFGSRTITLIDPTSGATSGPIRVRQDIEAIRFGINYQFWTGGLFFGNN